MAAQSCYELTFLHIITKQSDECCRTASLAISTVPPVNASYSIIHHGTELWTELKITSADCDSHDRATAPNTSPRRVSSRGR
jgi:hypothetical protein